MDYPLSSEEVERWESLAASAGILPTQDAPWAIAAAETLPGEPAFLAVGDGSCEALAPLVDRDHGFELAAARDLGEPCDLLAGPEALGGLVEQILELKRPLLLQRIPLASPTIEALRRADPGNRWVRVAEAAGHPTIALDERWAEPGGGLSSSRRSSLRRSRRKAESSGEVETLLLTPSPDELDALLEEAFEIEARSWKSAEGTAVRQVPHTQRFLRRYADELARRGQLRIDLLRIEGRGVAMQFGARWRDAHWLFKIGYDEGYRSASPGQLLLAESVAAAARDGLSTYELLGSRATWTDVWTEDVNGCAKVTVLPRSGRGVFAYGSIRWRGAERRLRRETSKAKAEIVSVAGSHYVAGPALAAALVEEDRYARAGFLTTVGFWNGTGDTQEKVAAEAKAGAEALRAGSEISIKLVPLGGDGPCLDELMEICERRGLTLHLDSLKPTAAEATRATALRLSERWPGRVGCTLPGRWKRSVEDARDLADSGLRIRVVKGEVEEADDDEPALDEGFLAIVEALAGGSCHVEVATQDAPLAERSLQLLQESGTSCEQQVLHAMHSAASLRVAHRLGVAIRVYVPYGTGRIPYSGGTIRRRPTVALSFARDVLPLPPRRPAIWAAYLFPFTDLWPF